ncbi:MAG: DEAD/DEAH box helicase [Treponema sp.]|jgi:ATP-dependent Lhr-like helicase|nr:DEAD/DEAH box helicase [Treponema sp.]
MVNPGPYSRLAPFIREYVYREKWTKLRKIQEEAIGEIFDRRNHLLIAAGTAAGKTEAAFFPLLSVLDRLSRPDADVDGSAGPADPRIPEPPRPLVLCVSPLKALINDQSRRLERIIRSGKDSGDAGRIPLWRWHGDAPETSKRRFLADPGGVLLITPESLESLLLHRGRELARIFGGLLFVVIDEVHVFMGSDRGSQLICQLLRIETALAETAGHNGLPPRRIGLSATLADYGGAQRWLSMGSDLPTAVAGGAGGSRRISIGLDYHRKRDDAFYRSIYGQCRNKRVIIFTNSRLEAEESAASLGKTARSLGEPDVFFVHHGSVSALLRGEAEESLKSGEGPSAACATATLELGIDIGSLDRIIQLGPPWSVSAFVQRLGRSGRRGGEAEMFFSIAAGDPPPRTPGKNAGPAAIAWDLLRTMAVIQLYLEERWIEPCEIKPLPYSLLVHETLSVLASLGEQNPQTLSRRVLSLPPFAGIPPEEYRTLLVWFEDCALAEKTEEGTYILGLEGARITGRHGFYSVFPGEETFRVLLEGREIGTVHFAPDPGSVLAVGGRRWAVRSVDGRRREIWVGETGDEGGERIWRGRGGGIHRRVAETMRRILTENTADAAYPYLSREARRALEESRRTAGSLGLTGGPLLEGEPSGGGGEKTETAPGAARTVYLFPWTGSAGMRTVEFLCGNSEHKKALKLLSWGAEYGVYFRLVTKLDPENFRSALAEASEKTLALLGGRGIPGKDPPSFGGQDPPYTDKYDYLLPPELLAKSYAANMLDPEAVRNLLRTLKGPR